MPDKNNQQNAVLILNNIHNVTAAILNRYDFGETGDLREFTGAYCEKYIEVYNKIESTYTEIKNQKVKIIANLLPTKE